jgi:hypothetical protein
MTKHLPAALAAGLIAGTPIVAAAQATATQPGPSWSILRTYVGTIDRIDTAARTVTTRDAAGRTWIFEAPPSLPSAQLATFKPGETVSVTFYDGLDARLRTGGGSSVASSIDPATGLRSATVTVVSIDPRTRTLTFVGPRGEYTRTMAEGGDTSVLRTLKPGQRIDLSYFEYVVSMRSGASADASAAPAVLQAPTPAPADSLRSRMTFNALYGVDNSFTGKMIQAATGRTTTGVPIDLTETSYDDVYGRLGLIKIGVGYLMTPRIEAVVNFVYSNSSASFESTQIGTAGTTGQIPLNVHFTNYRYVGVEGGQRFLFPRGRVTPFAGYLVGLNRNQDIRGTFVGVPVSSTPGLADQDGKFFERSWAFSLGPSGGVLIHAGQLDIVAETQLRFLGGLSDVDWLVEEGLRDINSESERWSVPFLAGVRFKF